MEKEKFEKASELFSTIEFIEKSINELKKVDIEIKCFDSHVGGIYDDSWIKIKTLVNFDRKEMANDIQSLLIKKLEDKVIQLEKEFNEL
jgi:hypothetical protein